MISNSKYGNAHKQELNFMQVVERWTSKVKFTPDGKLDIGEEGRIPCDTLYNCKRNIIQHLEKEENTIRNFKCAICKDYLYTENFNLYGEDEKTEKSVFGRNNAVRRQIVGRLDYKYGFIKNREKRKKPPNPNCPGNVKIVEDKFQLPCCQPLKSRDGVVKIIDPESKKDLESISTDLSENEDLPCCGGGPSCCRWCPETLCDSLEKASEALPKLWWHVCSGEDVNPSYDGFGKTFLGSSNSGDIPGEVKKEDKAPK